MYYRRFYKPAIDRSLALGLITTEQYDYILSFYEKDQLLIHGSLDFFKSVVPDIDVTEQPSGLSLVQVNTWPHLKSMCLKFAERNPRQWKYCSEEDVDLFYYDIETHSVLRPTSSPVEDGPNSSRHGIE